MVEQTEIKYYKWFVDTEEYCARVVMGSTANYYKNGELYAPTKW